MKKIFALSVGLLAAQILVSCCKTYPAGEFIEVNTLRTPVDSGGELER